MKNMIIKTINERFHNDVAHITMKDKNNTEVIISRYDSFLADDVMYEVSWGFNGSCGRYCDNMEQVADVIMNFDKINNDCLKAKADMMDMVMRLQLMIEGTLEATEEDIIELRSSLSDYSKSYYNFRYRSNPKHRSEW